MDHVSIIFARPCPLSSVVSGSGARSASSSASPSAAASSARRPASPRACPNRLMMLAVWIIGGLIVLCGALAFAELAASMPETGGMYVYLREGWGRPYAFLYGWAQLGADSRRRARRHLVGVRRVFPARLRHRPGGAPALGRLSRRRRHRLCRRRQHRRRAVGRAVHRASRRSRSSARSPLLVLASFAARAAAAAPSWSNLAPTDAPVQAGLFGLSLISVLWAYDGFADLSFASGEVKDPQRNLPRAIIFGTLAIIAIYLPANVAYLYMNPIDEGAELAARSPPTRCRRCSARPARRSSRSS